MELDHSSSIKLYQQVFDQVCDSIERGLLLPGMKLPPIRLLAEELGCSRNTIETAYQHLVQEGYVVGRQGSGYVVQDVALLHADPGKMLEAQGGQAGSIAGACVGATANARKGSSADSAASANVSVGEDVVSDADTLDTPAPTYDFAYGDLQAGTFPAAAWRMLTNEILSGLDRLKVDTYTDPLGEIELRRQIARQLNAARGISCRPEQIVVQGGTEQSVQNLLTLFDRARDIILMEEPGYNGVRDAFLRSGFRVKTVQVERGTSAYLRGIEKSRASLVFVTPSSQFPTCKAMDLDTRKRLLAWAEKTGAYILEDDYCREFRYLERPAPPMASMDTTGRIIYIWGRSRRRYRRHCA